MRPLRLTMSAFGPYADDTTIDFTKLEDRHLFLICGPTGAGKTTILDAMCYALYGRTSGDRTGSEMRSGYAPVSKRTEVTFDFMLGDKTYRAFRSPEQNVAKKRGQGLTTAAMQSSLSELVDGKEVHTIRTGVDQEASRLIGLNADQFCQVVLLPQGDFRKLLVAKAEEREGILKQLFRTNRFSAFQEELKNRWNEARNTRLDMKTRWETITGAGEEGSLPDQLSLVKSQLKDAEEKEKTAGKKASDFQKIVDENALLNGHFERLEQVKKRQEILFKGKDQRNQNALILEKIQHAEGLMAYFDALNDLVAAGKNLRVQSDDAKKNQEDLEKEALELSEKEKKLAVEKETVQKEQDEEKELYSWKPLAESYEAAKKKAETEEKLFAEAETQSKALKKTKEEKEKTASELEAKAEKLRASYIFGQAAILASELKEGEPCPVCGSVHHPHPAVSKDDLPSEEEVKTARDKAAAAREDSTKAGTAYMTYQSGTYTERSAAYHASQEELKKASALPEKWRDSHAIEKRIQAIDQHKKAFEAASQNLTKEKEKNASQLGQEKAKAESLTKQLEDSRKKYVEAAGELDRKAKEKGFTDKNDCYAYGRRVQEKPALQEAVTAYDSSVKAAESERKQEEAAIQGKEKPDMERLSQKMSQLRAEEKAAVAAASSLNERKTALEKKAKEAAALEKDLAQAEKKESLLQGLYTLVKGDTSRVTLERYVLGSLLDDVVAAANERLLIMSGRRYALRRMKNDESRVKGGLSLAVSDSFTGRSRPANTLSGGETFLASLSLALGLADVVQARAGGVRLDTMFIDEGFGTLDPEALNAAMNTLIDLQSTGRLVGIISHVPELEERVTARLRVEPSKKGSAAYFDIDG